MNLSEALSELKILRTRIARLIEIRQKTIKHDKDTVPEKTYLKLTEEIETLASTASKLKFKIAKANVETFVGLEKKDKTIQELIFEQGDVRSEISALQGILGLKGKKRWDVGVFEERYGKDDNTAYQTNRFAVEDKIKELETKKRKLDSQIQAANWRTKIE